MRAWVIGGALLALGACGQSAPGVTGDACADDAAEPGAAVAACTARLDSGALDERARAEALVHRGAAQLRLGQTTAALRDFEAAMGADAENVAAVLGRADILIQSGQLDAAAPLVARAIASGQSPARAHFLDGRIAAELGDGAAAMAAYNAAISADPRHVGALIARGRIHAQQSDHDAALADYTAALAIAPHEAGAHAGSCWAHLAKGEDGPARLAAEAAILADARSFDARLCHGLALLRVQEWDGARAAYDAALELQPGNPTALFGRGVARRRAGDGDGRRDMNQARDFSPHVGRVFEEAGVRTN